MTKEEIIKALVDTLETNQRGRAVSLERGDDDEEFYRGRKDALLQVLGWLDKEEADRQRAGRQ